MKKINYIEPISLARMLGLIIGSISALYVFSIDILIIKAMIVSRHFSWEFLYVWLFVVCYGVFAYVVGIICGYAYNFFAKRLGGIEFDFEEDA